MSADRHARWLLVAVVLAAVGASATLATPATVAAGDGPEADAPLASGATYASNTTLAVETTAAETTWAIYRVPDGAAYLTPAGEVSIAADGTGVIDLAERDLPPGSYAVGPDVYHLRHFEDGVARPLDGDERAAFRVVEQSLDARIETQRVDGAERRVLTVRSNLATDVKLRSETLSPGQLRAVFGGERTADGVVLDGGTNRTVVADLAGIAPGRHTIRATSTVGPASDTAVLGVSDPAASVAAYRALEPPTHALSPSEVMAAQGDYLAGETDLATVVAVLRDFFFR